MKITLLTIAILLSAVTAGLANIADPRLSKGKSIDTDLYIRLDRNATEARLIIPRGQLKQLRAELESLEGEDTTTAGSAVTRTQTIVSGGLLSLAFILGGMWFVRSGSKGSRAAIAAAMLLTSGSIVTFVYGNAGPPPEARSITGKMFTQGVHLYKQGSGRIKLEVSDKVRNPELIVPDPKQAVAEE